MTASRLLSPSIERIVSDEEKQTPESEEPTPEESAAESDEPTEEGTPAAETDAVASADDVDEEEASDDDASDEDASDEDEASDENEPSDDDDGKSAEAAAAAAAAAAVTKRRKKKTGRKKKAPRSTAGQRLAERKEKKAQRKIEEKHREAELLEEEAIEAAEEVEEAATDFFERNAREIAIGFAAVLLLGFGWLGFQKITSGAAKETTDQLWAALETAAAPIVPEDQEPPLGLEDETTYATAIARDDATLEQLRSVVLEAGSSAAGARAQLAIGSILLGRGENDDARAAFQAALEDESPDTQARALEGLGFVAEATDEIAEARQQFERLANLPGVANELLGSYHLARMDIASDDEAAASERLREVLERLRQDEAPELDYVRAEAEARLSAIDPTLVPQSAGDAFGGGLGGGGGGLEGIDPQVLEQLRRQLGEQGATLPGE